MTKRKNPAWNALLAYLGREGEDPASGYERMRSRLAAFFRSRGAAGAEDLADQTFDRVGRKLLEGTVFAPPPAYCLGVARNVLREHWRSRERTGLEQVRPPTAPPAPEPHPGLECLDLSLDRLDPADRELLLAYYAGSGGERIAARRMLAKSEGMTPTALRMRMHRLRVRIEREILDCLDRRSRDGNASRRMEYREP